MGFRVMNLSIIDVCLGRKNAATIRKHLKEE
jgi:hypothetical protein